MPGDRLRCGDVDGVADELVLGQLGEPGRSDVLAHAAGCDRCDLLLGDLADVTDRLLQLAPDADPPPGFEGRTVARLAPPAARREWRGRVLVAGATAAAVVVAVALILSGGGDDRRRDGTVLSRDGDPVGTVEVDLGDDPRLVLTMPGPARWPGTWVCELLMPGSGWVEVGRWTADEVTAGVWAIDLGPAHDGPTAMRVRNDRGDVIATAALQ
jgi:hypothetical protein